MKVSAAGSKGQYLHFGKFARVRTPGDTVSGRRQVEDICRRRADVSISRALTHQVFLVRQVGLLAS